MQQTCVRLVARPDSDQWLTDAHLAWGGVPEPSLRLDIAGLDGVTYRIEADWAARTIELSKRP